MRFNRLKMLRGNRLKLWHTNDVERSWREPFPPYFFYLLIEKSVADNVQAWMVMFSQTLGLKGIHKTERWIGYLLFFIFFMGTGHWAA